MSLNTKKVPKGVLQTFVVLFFLLLYIVIFIITTAYKNDYIQNIYTQQIKYLDNTYQVSKEHFKNISQNFYDSILNQPQVLKLFADAKHAKSESQRAQIRKEMYKLIRPHFERMSDIGVIITLFSFNDNHTFLRVHKPSKYSDDLSSVRYSITYANKSEKSVFGFEQGKVSHAFRNIYPLRYEKEFLGSVDIAFSSDYLQESMANLYDLDTHFILNKDIFEVNIWNAQKKVRYIQSIEHENYLYAITDTHSQRDFSKMEIMINSALKDDIKRNIEHSNSFVLHHVDKDTHKAYVMGFLPINNIKEKKRVAYLVSYSYSFAIEKMLHEYYWINIGSLAVLFLIALLIYKNINQRFLLEIRVNEEVAKNRVQQQQIFNQTRLAQMGELISMIAHQWRQPLGAISVVASDMKLKIDLDQYQLPNEDGTDECKNYFLDSLARIGSYVKALTNTIDDFRNFYKPNKKSMKQSVTKPIDMALSIVRGSLESDNIEIIEKYKSQNIVEMYENELMQVVLNILKNAQDNFKMKQTENRKITIETQSVEDAELIKIEDNGGGIPEDILESIFDPYFSTKSEKQGSGLGLHMSKIIVEEHHKGILSVRNSNEGVCFTIEINREI